MALNPMLHFFLLLATTMAPVTPTTPAPPVRVALETNMGRIELELWPDKAPATVKNFLAYVDDGHYSGTIFHRVVAGVLIQGGEFTPDLQAKPERDPIANEAGNGLRNTRGSLSAARLPSNPDSAASQFFINLTDNSAFDGAMKDAGHQGAYCVFGQVIDGMSIVEKIAATPVRAAPPVSDALPQTPIVIELAHRLP